MEGPDSRDILEVEVTGSAYRLLWKLGARGAEKD